MHTETITVAYVNQPKPGKKFGSIKTEDGIYYSVGPAQLGLFKPGGTYEIKYKFDESGQYRNFISMAGASPSNGSAAPAGNGHAKSEEMFVMGVIGRCIQGVGTLPDASTLTDWVRRCRSAFKAGMADKPARSDEPLDDEVPF